MSIEVDAIACTTLFTSSARTSSPTAVECILSDKEIRGCFVFIKVTALADTPSVVPTFEIHNDLEDEWVELKAFTAITDATGVGNYLYFVYPEEIADLGIGTVDEVLAFPLPWKFRVSMVHGDADSITYSGEISGLR